MDVLDELISWLRRMVQVPRVHGNAWQSDEKLYPWQSAFWIVRRLWLPARRMGAVSFGKVNATARALPRCGDLSME